MSLVLHRIYIKTDATTSSIVPKLSLLSIMTITSLIDVCIRYFLPCQFYNKSVAILLFFFFGGGGGGGGEHNYGLCLASILVPITIGETPNYVLRIMVDLCWQVKYYILEENRNFL